MQQGDCAIITGASRGIGRSVAVRLAQAGLNVIINYAKSREGADETAELARKAGVRAEVFMADVSDYAQAAELIAFTQKEFGGIYALINNAGITRDTLIMRMRESDFDDVIATNLKGAYNCLKHVSGIMLRQRRGRIVNISSVAGIIGNAGQANYSAAKAGLIGLTKAAARELAPRGITVNAVAPGLIETDMSRAIPEDAKKALLERIPLGRLGEPSEIADIVEFLVSERAAYITGQVICVDGGLAM